MTLTNNFLKYHANQSFCINLNQYVHFDADLYLDIFFSFIKIACVQGHEIVYSICLPFMCVKGILTDAGAEVSILSIGPMVVGVAVVAAHRL